MKKITDKINDSLLSVEKINTLIKAIYTVVYHEEEHDDMVLVLSGSIGETCKEIIAKLEEAYREACEAGAAETAAA